LPVIVNITGKYFEPKNTFVIQKLRSTKRVQHTFNTGTAQFTTTGN